MHLKPKIIFWTFTLSTPRYGTNAPWPWGPHIVADKVSRRPSKDGEKMPSSPPSLTTFGISSQDSFSGSSRRNEIGSFYNPLVATGSTYGKWFKTILSKLFIRSLGNKITYYFPFRNNPSSHTGKYALASIPPTTPRNIKSGSVPQVGGHRPSGSSNLILMVFLKTIQGLTSS
jgi:hypothetical protein